MYNIIEIGFGNDKSRSKKNQTNKIYNQGNIVVSRPQSSKNPYKILSIKKFESSKNLKFKNITHKKHPKSHTKIKPQNNDIKINATTYNNRPVYEYAGYKILKRSVTEMHKIINKEIDEMDQNEELKKNVGYILRNSFTEEELKNNFEFGPSPKKNKNKILSHKKNISIKQKIKPYIPDLD